MTPRDLPRLIASAPRLLSLSHDTDDTGADQGITVYGMHTSPRAVPMRPVPDR